MKLFKYTILTAILLVSFSCKPSTKASKEVAIKVAPEKVMLSAEELQEYETAYFASGCFWCVEAIFESVKGVKEVISGYSGGVKKNPTYREVAYGLTRHAEAVEVYYDPKVISFQKLVQVFFGSHDPTTLNRQGYDVGTQYRSGIYYTSDAQKTTAEQVKKDFAPTLWDNPIVTEIEKLGKFYTAEAYHQNYYTLNPNYGYCRAVINPKLSKFRKKYREKLK